LHARRRVRAGAGRQPRRAEEASVRLDDKNVWTKNNTPTIKNSRSGEGFNVTRDQPIPAYGGTVFISYARDDNDAPPLKDAPKGWVSFFWEQLRWALTDAGMPQAKLWVDRYQIEPTEVFTQKIEDALKQACLIIPILSSNWVQRDWCRKELSRFVELRGREDIVLIKKNEPPDADVPEPLRNREGYKFFTQDPAGKVRDFYWADLRDQVAYYDVLKRITDWIVARLKVKPRTKPTKPTSNGRVVYLAAPADELRDAWQRVANDLEGSGYMVLPPEGRLPDTAAEAEAAIRNYLAKAVLSVHFLGDSEGGNPGGSDETVVRLQLRIARQQPGPNGQIARLLWAPKWLPERRERKRDPFEVLKRYGGLSPGEEVYAEEATDLSKWLRTKLDPPKPVAAAAVQRLLIAGAMPNDDDLVARLANLVQSDEINVKALFAGEAAAVCNLAPPTCVITLWGNASGPAIATLLDSVEPFGRRFILCLPGGDEAAKRRFFREGIYLEKLDALPTDRKTATQLLVRLEILNPSEKSDR
jgi:hypothetical protein